ncbi:hypothetical protein AAG570_006630 [Ranatra chinensis]|uniref:Uncharacterized protein n=1 Tax=Ranatra chinensis TaxID=642074 RepID=A0ABD0YUM2_9HEMI
MASKRGNTFCQNKKQETTGIEPMLCLLTGNRLSSIVRSLIRLSRAVNWNHLFLHEAVHSGKFPTTPLRAPIWRLQTFVFSPQSSRLLVEKGFLPAVGSRVQPNNVPDGQNLIPQLTKRRAERMKIRAGEFLSPPLSRGSIPGGEALLALLYEHRPGGFPPGPSFYHQHKSDKSSGCGPGALKENVSSCTKIYHVDALKYFTKKWTQFSWVGHSSNMNYDAGSTAEDAD